MELLDGEPLGARVARGPLPLGDAVSIPLATLGAMSAIHGIAHRDLKPSNIYLTPHGVKLLDFALARSIDSALAATRDSLTVAGVIVGTPRYMLPEQAAGDAVDARSDLFALGALLYEMLSGRPAFAGDTAVRVLHAVIYDPPPPPHLLGATTPPLYDSESVIPYCPGTGWDPADSTGIY